MYKKNTLILAVILTIITGCTPTPSKSLEVSSSPVFTSIPSPTITPTPALALTSTTTSTPSPFPAFLKEPVIQWVLGNPDCKLPCWGGIIIGKTSLQDAYSLLEPALKLNALHIATCRLGQCKWYPWIYTFDQKSYSGAVLGKEDNIVYSITAEGDYSDEVSLPRLLSLYGNPSKTFVYAHVGLPPDNIAPLDLILLYSQEKFVVRYRWLIETSGQNIKACGPSQYFTLSAIQHTEAEWTDLEIDQAAHQLNYTSQVSNIKRFQDATGQVADDFFEKIKQGDMSFCISTPAKEWGG